MAKKLLHRSEILLRLSRPQCSTRAEHPTSRSREATAKFRIHNFDRIVSFTCREHRTAKAKRRNHDLRLLRAIHDVLQSPLLPRRSISNSDSLHLKPKGTKSHWSFREGIQRSRMVTHPAESRRGRQLRQIHPGPSDAEGAPIDRPQNDL